MIIFIQQALGRNTFLLSEWEMSVYISSLPKGIFRVSERSHLFLYQSAIPLSGKKNLFFPVINGPREKQPVSAMNS